MTEFAKCRAERDRLRNELGKEKARADTEHAGVTMLRARVEKLEAALRQIADGRVYAYSASEFAKYARDALAPPGEGASE